MLETVKIKQWRTYPIVASSKAANVLHNTNQPSISTISRISATWLVSPSFGYSVWPDTVKGKSTMLRDWQNPLHVNMWEQGVKFLMPLILRIFLKLFAEKPNPTFFLKLIDVDDLVDSLAEARLKKYLMIEGTDNFQVMVFQSSSTTFKAAFLLCICDCWLTDYGSCSLFS